MFVTQQIDIIRALGIRNMKLKVLFGLMAGVFCTLAYADTQEWSVQRSLHPHMVPFQFEFWVNKDKVNEQFAYLKIKSPDGSVIQTIPQLNINLSQADLTFVDINSDGLYELKLNTRSLLTRASQQYFVYNNQQNKFIEAQQVASSSTRDESSHNLNDFLEHLISRKGVCLAKVKEFGMQDKETEGLYEANQCLNTIAYELIPLIAARNPDKPITVQLKTMLETHAQFIKDVTVCSDTQKPCEVLKNQASLKANIKFVNNIVEQLVTNIGTEDMNFNQQKWLAQWDGLNAIMQG
tara:strand:+ start:108244 stop:109125 length:882 start_codon:yes stop_codon:yes gene_type:complete